VWLRDSATLIGLARYHYPLPFLASWIEEHFAHQAENGELQDWIAAGPVSEFQRWAPNARSLPGVGALALSADKNTVEADQESSAVLAAARVYAVTRDGAWLARPVRGVSLLERCQRALQFLVRRRSGGAHGLVLSGFSADWGDVSPVHADQRALYLDAGTPRVAGLYTNALFLSAAQALAELLRERGEPGRAAYWDAIVRHARVGVEAALWQPQRGFYRMHVPETAAPGFDDSHIFAMAGHAEALAAGLVDEGRARRVFQVAEAGRREHGVSTIAGTLLPPFPRAFFRHPALAEPWSYQNGGQWDWFAGRFVLAAFERGESERAFAWLQELAEKARRNGGLHEWHTRDGVGRGSPHYAGSAGALARALYEGAFGVRWSGERLDLDVRLGGRSGAIELQQPATGGFMGYRYVAEAGSLSLDCRGDRPRSGSLALRLPPGRRAAGVSADGRSLAFDERVVGSDRYIVLRERWPCARVEVRLAEATRRSRAPAASRASRG
jgi:hypothetical protein